MDADERIADYLSDDLAPDERAAFEAELARDAALRAQVEAAERADAALASMAPTELPEGFAARLRTALDAELAEVLAPAATTAPDPRVAAEAELGQRDELAARRAARTVPRWAGGLAGAAAAVLVAVAGVAGLSSIGGGADEAPESATGESLDADSGGGAETFETHEAETQAEATEESAADDAAASSDGEAAFDEGTVTMRAAAQPVLVARDRLLADDDLERLLLDEALSGLAAQRLPVDEGQALAADYRDRWSATEGDATVEEVGTPEPDDRRAVAQCLAGAAEAGRTEGITAYAELAHYQDQPVVVLGLVTLDPDTGTWSVPAVQVYDRASCDLLAARP